MMRMRKGQFIKSKGQGSCRFQFICLTFPIPNDEDDKQFRKQIFSLIIIHPLHLCKLTLKQLTN